VHADAASETWQQCRDLRHLRLSSSQMPAAHVQVAGGVRVEHSPRGRAQLSLYIHVR